ncbi:MAG: hypothetical protein WAO76_09145 [Georgfuchsia sp.]
MSNANRNQKSANRKNALAEISNYLGGAFRKTGERRYPGGRLVSLEAGKKSVIANFKTIFRKGKPTGSRIEGWVAV